MKRLSEEELAAIEEQLPWPPSPKEPFNMDYGMDAPISNFEYLDDPKKPGTVVIPLDKRRYASMTEAKERMAALLEHRKLKSYYSFHTARYFVFWCLPK